MKLHHATALWLLALSSAAMAQESENIQVGAPASNEEPVAIFAQIGGSRLKSDIVPSFTAGFLGRLSGRELAVGLAYRSWGSLRVDQVNLSKITVASINALGNYRLLRSGAHSTELDFSAGYGWTQGLYIDGEALQKSFVSSTLGIAQNYQWSPKWTLSALLAWHQPLFSSQEALSNAQMMTPTFQLGVRWQP